MRFAWAIEESTPYRTARPSGQAARKVRGIVLHHTATAAPCKPHANGSWHYLVTRDGQVVAPVDEDDVAWHAARTDRWRPAWVAESAPWFSGSAINSCTVGIELVGHPQLAPGYTEPQLEALGRLLADIDARHGGVWLVGHGEVQADRSDPASFPWARFCGDDFDPKNGRRLLVTTGMNDTQRQLFDACERHGLANAGDIDQLMGRYDLLAQQVQSLEQLLHQAQSERDEAIAQAEGARNAAAQQPE